MSQLSQLRRADASSRLVLLVVCAGVVLASLDLFIVNVALPEMAQDLGTAEPGRPLVGAERLRDHLRRAAAAASGGWPSAAGATSASCSASRSSPSPRRPAPRPTRSASLVAFRVLQAAGAALLTPTSLGLVLATTAPERRPGAVRVWTAVGGAAAALGPGRRRPAGRRLLALGLPGQRAGRPGRARRRLAPAAARARATTCRTRTRSAPLLATVGVGALDPRPGQGRGLGLERAATLVTLVVAAVTLGALRGAHATPPQPARRPGAVPGAGLPRRQRVDGAVLDRVRGDAALDRPLDAGRVGLVGAEDRPGDRARAADGPALRRCCSRDG